MADWNTPTTGTDYLDVLDNLKARDVNSGTLFSDSLTAATNIPTGAIRYNRASNKFQEWSGAAWVDKILSVAGGGTGSTTAAGARTALGLGSMATQAASGVAITGGSISGVTISGLDASAVFGSGIIGTAFLGSGLAGADTLLHGDSSWSNLLHAFEAKGYFETLQTVAPVAGVVTIDLSLGNNILIQLTANVTSIIFNNPAVSGKAQGFVIELEQDATGGRTVTGWPASVDWGTGVSAPTISAGANKSDFITFLTRNAGTVYRAFVAGQNYQ